MKKNGFTLIELMIVIAIIALLAAVALPKFAAVTDDAKAANIRSNLSAIRTGISMFNAKLGGYPVYVNSTTLGTNDIAKDGQVSTKLQTYYEAKGGKLASTPGVTSSSGVSIDESSAVVTSNDGTGGWVYTQSNGGIYANFSANVLGVSSWGIE